MKESNKNKQNDTSQISFEELIKKQKKIIIISFLVFIAVIFLVALCLLIAFLVETGKQNNKEDNENDKKDIDDSNNIFIPLIIFSVLFVFLILGFVSTYFQLKYSHQYMLEKRIPPFTLLLMFGRHY